MRFSLHKQSGIYIIFQIQIISPLARVVGNVSAAVQALCTPCSYCGMDGYSGGEVFYPGLIHKYVDEK